MSKVGTSMREAQRRRSTLPSREIIELRLWIFKFSDEEQFGVCVEGYREEDETAEKLRNWVSTPIEKHLSRTRLVTRSGGTYLLKGTMDEIAAKQYGYPETLIELFRDGFPPDWNDLLREYYNKVKSTNAMNAGEWFNKSMAQRKRLSMGAPRTLKAIKDTASANRTVTSKAAANANRRQSLNRRSVSVLPNALTITEIIEENEEEDKENGSSRNGNELTPARELADKALALAVIPSTTPVRRSPRLSIPEAGDLSKKKAAEKNFTSTPKTAKPTQLEFESPCPSSNTPRADVLSKTTAPLSTLQSKKAANGTPKAPPSKNTPKSNAAGVTETESTSTPTTAAEAVKMGSSSKKSASKSKVAKSPAATSVSTSVPILEEPRDDSREVDLVVVDEVEVARNAKKSRKDSAASTVRLAANPSSQSKSGTASTGMRIADNIDESRCVNTSSSGNPRAASSTNDDTAFRVPALPPMRGQRQQPQHSSADSSNTSGPCSGGGPIQEETDQELYARSVRLSNWVVIFGHYNEKFKDLDHPPFVLMGINEDNADLGEWTSTTIVRVRNDRFFFTMSGSVYYLEGPLNVLHAAKIGFPRDFVRHFYFGFPPNWREQLGDLYSALFPKEFELMQAAIRDRAEAGANPQQQPIISIPRSDDGTESASSMESGAVNSKQQNRKMSMNRGQRLDMHDGDAIVEYPEDNEPPFDNKRQQKRNQAQFGSSNNSNQTVNRRHTMSGQQNSHLQQFDASVALVPLPHPSSRRKSAGGAVRYTSEHQQRPSHHGGSRDQFPDWDPVDNHNTAPRDEGRNFVLSRETSTAGRPPSYPSLAVERSGRDRIPVKRKEPIFSSSSEDSDAFIRSIREFRYDDKGTGGRRAGGPAGKKQRMLNSDEESEAERERDRERHRVIRKRIRRYQKRIEVLEELDERAKDDAERRRRKRRKARLLRERELQFEERGYIEPMPERRRQSEKGGMRRGREEPQWELARVEEPEERRASKKSAYDHDAWRNQSPPRKSLQKSKKQRREMEKTRSPVERRRQRDVNSSEDSSSSDDDDDSASFSSRSSTETEVEETGDWRAPKNRKKAHSVRTNKKKSKSSSYSKKKGNKKEIARPPKQIKTKRAEVERVEPSWSDEEESSDGDHDDDYEEPEAVKRPKSWKSDDVKRLKHAIAVVSLHCDDHWEKVARSLQDQWTPEECKQTAIKRLKWTPPANYGNSAQNKNGEEGGAAEDGAGEGAGPVVMEVTARQGTAAYQVQADQFTRKFMMGGASQEDDFYRMKNERKRKNKNKGGDETTMNGEDENDVMGENEEREEEDEEEAAAPLPDLAAFDPDDSLLDVIKTPVVTGAKGSRRIFIPTAVEDSPATVFRRRSTAVVNRDALDADEDEGRSPGCPDSTAREQQNRYVHQLMQRNRSRHHNPNNTTRFGNSTMFMDNTYNQSAREKTINAISKRVDAIGKGARKEGKKNSKKNRIEEYPEEDDEEEEEDGLSVGNWRDSD